MNNVLITASLATVLTLSSAASLAGNYKHHDNKHSFKDTARVTHVETLYKTVRISTPQRECWDRTPSRSSYNNQRGDSYTSTIIGGIVGGVIGNQFGGGSGKTALTVAGTLLGGSIGRDLRHQPKSHSRYDHGEQCRVTQRYHEEQQIDGYQVSYKYQGQTYTTHMDYDPGRRLPIEVSVRPATHRYY
ncbi:MAG: glycine zipper 2TM domain-containing protein [Methylophagaceae bacterium]